MKEEKNTFFERPEYDLPEARDGYLDTSKGEIKKKEDLTPFDVIKAVAVQTNTVIKDPRKGCHKCYGRGYIGIDSDTKSPIPCNCIYPPKTDTQKMGESLYDNSKVSSSPNRQQRRNFKKIIRREIKSGRLKLEKKDDSVILTSATDEQKEVTNGQSDGIDNGEQK